MLNLIIKGTPEDARAAAQERGIPYADASPISERETALKVYPNHEDKVVKWYVENAVKQAPYPVGTLLFFGSVPAS